MWKIYLETVKPPAGIEGFLLLAKGWIIERIFSWLGGYRR